MKPGRHSGLIAVLRKVLSDGRLHTLGEILVASATCIPPESAIRAARRGIRVKVDEDDIPLSKHRRPAADEETLRWRGMRLIVRDQLGCIGAQKIDGPGGQPCYRMDPPAPARCATDGCSRVLPKRSDPRRKYCDSCVVKRRKASTNARAKAHRERLQVAL